MDCLTQRSVFIHLLFIYLFLKYQLKKRWMVLKKSSVLQIFPSRFFFFFLWHSLGVSIFLFFIYLFFCKTKKVTSCRKYIKWTICKVLKLPFPALKLTKVNWSPQRDWQATSLLSISGCMFECQKLPQTVLVNANNSK